MYLGFAEAGTAHRARTGSGPRRLQATVLAQPASCVQRQAACREDPANRSASARAAGPLVGNYPARQSAPGTKRPLHHWSLTVADSPDAQHHASASAGRQSRLFDHGSGSEWSRPLARESGCGLAKGPAWGRRGRVDADCGCRTGGRPGARDLGAAGAAGGSGLVRSVDDRWTARAGAAVADACDPARYAARPSRRARHAWSGPYPEVAAVSGGAATSPGRRLRLGGPCGARPAAHQRLRPLRQRHRADELAAGRASSGGAPAGPNVDRSAAGASPSTPSSSRLPSWANR
jgi:hypothetical protein